MLAVESWSVVLIIGLVAALVAAVVAGWCCYRLLVDRGRLLLMLEALEAQLRRAPATDREVAKGPPVGSVLPDFELPDLTGRNVTLSAWRGRRVLLVFVDPHCEFSHRMLPDLADFKVDPNGVTPTLLLISTGDPEENRRLIEASELRCPVLLQAEREVARLYRIGATPIGLLVDELGQTAVPPALGVAAVISLVRGEPVAATGLVGEVLAGGSGGPTDLTAAPSERRINRSGLPTGIVAPEFRLPCLDGGELSPTDLGGRRFVLVLFDPVCAACESLALRLESIHRAASGVGVVMVSRGDPAANRAIVARHGLTFPIAMQRHREIARAYGMFATPAGYLIDERGVIAAPVAVGGEAVLALWATDDRPSDRTLVDAWR